MLIKIFDINIHYVKMLEQLSNPDNASFLIHQNESINMTNLQKICISSMYINPRTKRYV